MTTATHTRPDSVPVGDWREHADCAGFDPELWYATGTTAADLRRSAQAKRICAGCPVRRQCLDDATAREGAARADGRHGIWGGLDGRERHNLYKQRTRAAARDTA